MYTIVNHPPYNVSSVAIFLHHGLASEMDFVTDTPVI